MKNKKISSALLLMMLLANSCSAFSVDFAPGTPLVEALRALGYKANRNVIINGDIKGTVSMYMADTTFEEALKSLAVTNNFSYEINDKNVLIAPQKALNTIETFKLQHAEPEIVAKQMAVLLENDDDVVVNNDSHSITVLGSSNILNRVAQQIKKIDQAQQQVTINAEVIEINRSKAREMGISYFSDNWSKDTSIAGYNGFKFSVSAAHQETQGKGKVLARPSITTFDGRAATIMMGDKVPVFTSTSTSNSADSNITVEYKDVGVKLDVLPRINDLDKEIITVAIKPSISTITQWVESGNNKAPQISERSAETIVRVKSGETILIGGLLKEEEIKSFKAIPFISKIPILGELFKSRSLERKNSEIVIAITPTIVFDENGRPKVEIQRTTDLMKKHIHQLKKEVSEYNTQGDPEIMDATKEKRLKKEVSKYKKEAVKKDSHEKQLKKELEKNNAILRSIIERKKKNE